MEVHGELKDDPSIPDTERLNRGIHHSQLLPDNAVTSAAFPIHDHISVDLSSLSSPEESLTRRPTSAAVAQLIAGGVRELTPGVVRDPVVGNPSHSLIIRDPRLTNGDRKKVARKLARSCILVLRR